MDGRRKIDGAEWERLEPADYAMRLLTMAFSRTLNGLLRSNTLYAMNGDKLFECSAAQQFRFTAPAVPFLFATLGAEISHLVQTERTAIYCAAVVEIDSEVSAAHSETSSAVQICL